MIIIKINNVDISSKVLMGSVKKTDNINQRVDTLQFETYKYGSITTKPEVGQEVAMYDDANLVYGGVTTKVEESMDFNKEITYSVDCKDWSQYLDRSLVVERYKDITVNEVIKDIYYRYIIDWKKGMESVSLPYQDDVYSFEVPDVSAEPGKFKLRPNGYTWAFSGRSGLAENGSAYGQANATDGNQVMTLQDDAGTGDGPGYGYKYMNPLVSGYYVFAFKSTKRPGYSDAKFDIKVNGVVKQSFTISHTDFKQYFSDPIYIASGFTEVGFAVTGTNMTAFVDEFKVSTVNTFNVKNVNCELNVKTVAFNRISVTAALEKLSKLTNFQWYVDYDKSIYFFEKNTINSPFNLSDTLENHIYNSLFISNDISQLRNRVYIRGGESEGALRTESQNGDGVKKHFVLANKFSQMPVVKIGGVTQTCGLDYLTPEDAADCFWSYQEKYVRFRVAPTSGTNNITFEGIPLFPVQVQFQDSISIEKYGVYEFAKKDLTIKSKEEAFAFAKAELEAYGQSVIEGGFKTYISGLRSGQIINVASANRGFDEDLLIQSVSMSMISGGDDPLIIYDVKLATLRTMSIISILIDLLRSEDRLVNDTADETLEKAIFNDETINVAETFSITAAVDLPDENINVNETFIDRGLDYPVEFVLGDIYNITYPNSDFENGFSEYTPVGVNGGVVSIDTTTKYQGTKSVKMSLPGTSSYCELFLNGELDNFIGYLGKSKCKVLPNTKYKFHYWMKTQYYSGSAPAGQGAGMSFIESKADGTNAGIQADGARITTTTNWTEYVVEFTTTANTSYIQPIAFCYGHWAPGTLSMNAWFDNVWYEIDEPKKKNFILNGSPLAN
jgi:hypothetical protein